MCLGLSPGKALHLVDVCVAPYFTNLDLILVPHDLGYS